MNDHKKNDHAPDEDSARKEYAEMSGGAEQGSGEPTEEDVLLRLAAENEEMKDKALRLAAEMENLRRRTARDVQDARTYAIAAFARDMLSVSDNLGRALEAIPAEAKASGDAGFKALIDGVEMTVFEDFVVEQVKNGATIIGLYPPTMPENQALFAEWREKNGR